MHLQQIRYFLALADELHFWNTAAKMNITQSALTRQIQALESELGLLLFERDKRNVQLTPAGNFLKEKWEVEFSKIEYLHKYAQRMHMGESGTITIAHPDSISASLMPDILARIKKKFPLLQIRLVQVMYENEHEFLRNYKIDLAISRDFDPTPDIKAEKIYTDYLAFVVPENHAFRRIKDISKESLSRQKFILPTIDQGSSYGDIIQQMFNSYDITPDVSLQSAFGSAIIALVRKKLGIAVLPDSYKHHEIPGIRFISTPFETSLFIKWRTDDVNPLLSNVLKTILP